MTIPQVADRLNVSEKTVRRLIVADMLPALRVGGSIRLDRSELEEWLYGGSGGLTSSPPPVSPAARRGPEEASPAVEPQRG